MMDYSTCCLQNKSCGPHARSRTSGVFKVNELNSEINSHLICLKLQRHYEKAFDLDEKTLIENRMGRKFRDDDDQICAFHSSTLGIG